MAKELKKHYSARELSAFCLQISLLLRAAIPLDEGLSVMAEDAADEDEKKPGITYDSVAIPEIHIRKR